MRAHGLGAHTPLPHAAHSLSLECPSQRNRHLSRRLAAERARGKLGSRWCAFGAPDFEKEGESSLHARPRPQRSHPATPRGPQPQPRVPQPKKPPSKPQARRRTRERKLGSRWCAFGAPAFEKEGESSLHARPWPRRSHPATPRGPQPQPRVPQPKKPPSKPQARRRTRERSSEVGGVLSARRRSKRKGRARFMRAHGLGAHTPLPHAAHSLSLECPSQRNRHLSRRLAAERARGKLGSRWCAFGAPAFEKEGESSLHARPWPRRSHPATPRGPQPQPRVPQPKKPPSKPQARRRTRERSSEVGGVLSARRRWKRKGRARFMRAHGLGAHTPLPHAAHSLSLECPSQRNRHLSRRLAAERARGKL